MMNFVKVCKALADQTRVDILKKIREMGEISCGKITELFPLSQPTISYHLKILQDAGLLKVRKAAQYSYYSINETVFRECIEYLQQHLLETDSLASTSEK